MVQRYINQTYCTAYTYM